MNAFTDYPFTQLGDIEGQKAPVRSCIVTGYDGDKYCRVVVGNLEASIKSGYLYKEPGRYGQAPGIDVSVLPKINKL